MHVNKIDLDLATGKVGYESILIDSRLDARANADYPAFKEWLRPYCSEVQALNGNIIGTCARFMINRDNSDAGLSNWAADALYEAGLKQFGKIDFAVMNTGGLRKPLPEGKISEGRLVEIMPFKNSLTVVEMTGDVLTEMLTQMASKGKAVPSKQVSGTYYKKSNTIDVRINGKKIKPTQTYRVITVDYLANGGDYLYAFTKGRKVWEDKEPYRGYILDYIRDLDSRGIKVDGPAKMRVVTK